MTDPELQQLARQYGAHLAKDIPEANCLKNEIVNANYDYIMKFLEWLSNRYCIVEKEHLNDINKEVTRLYLDQSHITFDGWHYILKELFNETK